MTTDKKTVKWRGLDVEVKETREAASEPWDGDESLDDPDAEGYDLEVEVELKVDGHAFKGFTQVAGNWIHPDRAGYDYLDSQIKDLTEEALDGLGREVARVASGEDVLREKARQGIAALVVGQK
jgi:hypothetical protein